MSRFSLTKKGIEVKAGTIDSGYTGNIGVLLYNNSQVPHTIQPQERIAQAVFLQLAPIERMKPVPTRQELEESTRGTGGFGSTDNEEIKTFFFNQEKESNKPVE